jgi:hypothetical protein
MQNIPVYFEDYVQRVVEEPAPKQKRDGSGPALGRDGAIQYQVSLFVKRIPVEGDEWTPKGEEIRVTLDTDPGEGFQEGMRVELVSPTVSSWEMRNEETGRVTSGLSFRALGLKPGLLPSRTADK